MPINGIWSSTISLVTGLQVLLLLFEKHKLEKQVLARCCRPKRLLMLQACLHTAKVCTAKASAGDTQVVLSIAASKQTGALLCANWFAQRESGAALGSQSDS